MTTMRTFARILLPLLLAACGGDDPAGAGGDIAAELASIQAEIFDRRCNMPACHSTKSHAGGLVLEAGVSHGQLVGVASTLAPTKVRVTAGDPDASFLLDKVVPPVDSSEGMVMPWGAPEGLATHEVAALRGWIEQGAGPD